MKILSLETIQRGDVIGLGKVAITLEHSITNVLHVDSLSYNLLSISQLCEMGYNYLFTDKGVEVFRREDSPIIGSMSCQL